MPKLTVNARLTLNNVSVTKVGEDYQVTPIGGTPPPPSPPPPPPTSDPNLEFKGNFSKPDGTVLGEKQGDGELFVTSGELLWRGGLWTSNSPTFRMVTLRDTFTDVALGFKAKINRFLSGSQEAYDGLHVFMRYRSQYHCYYVSFMRRDQTAALKKKCPGSTNEIAGDPHGFYYDFTSVPNAYELNTWYDVQIIAKNDVSDTMKLSLSMNGKLISSYSDNGKDKAGKAHICNQIMRGGAVGVRSDNCEWEAKDFSVTSRFPYP